MQLTKGQNFKGLYVGVSPLPKILSTPIHRTIIVTSCIEGNVAFSKLHKLALENVNEDQSNQIFSEFLIQNNQSILGISYITTFRTSTTLLASFDTPFYIFH